MSSAKLAEPSQPIKYPGTEGEPTAEDTIQYNTITTVKGSLEIQFSNHQLAFLAADLCWYPQERQRADLRTAQLPNKLRAVGIDLVD